MYGIAGLWGQADEALVRTMLEQLSHRGADAHGFHYAPHGTLGLLRDASGHNPPAGANAAPQGKAISYQ